MLDETTRSTEGNAEMNVHFWDFHFELVRGRAERYVHSGINECARSWVDDEKSGR